MAIIAPLRVIDLFSGIGGFSLGLERTGAFQTVAFCELDPFCTRVLRKHWPEVPIYDDIRRWQTAFMWHADVICGGPPCQRTSVAAAIQGKRTGETLWPEMCRIIRQCRPRWVIIEQPPGNAAWEEAVANDLALAGYCSARFERSARSCGAPHLRRRVFFVAHALRERCQEVARRAGSPEAAAVAWPAPPRGTWRTPGTGDRRVDDGLSGWMDRLRALGNAVFPQIPELIGHAIVATESA